jgi:hypothetical protein
LQDICKGCGWPAWVISIPCPATVSVPEREVVAGLAKNVAVAVPAAVPPEGEILIQAASVTEVVHAPPLHPEGPVLVIVNEAVPPVANTVGTEVGAAVKVQAGIAPS